jgi:hypothetical protein
LKSTLKARPSYAATVSSLFTPEIVNAQLYPLANYGRRHHHRRRCDRLRRREIGKTVTITPPEYTITDEAGDFLTLQAYTLVSVVDDFVDFMRAKPDRRHANLTRNTHHVGRFNRDGENVWFSPLSKDYDVDRNLCHVAIAALSAPELDVAATLSDFLRANQTLQSSGPKRQATHERNVALTRLLHLITPG